MTPEKLREAVARAMREKYGHHYLPSGRPTKTWAEWLEIADAALAVVREAMRKPSEEMLGAAFKASVAALSEANDHCETDEDRSAHAIRPLWRAMLAASPLREE